MNRLPAGCAAITELARQTNLHRTTVKRLLETLRDEGYVSHDLTTNEYHLTLRVQQLSSGFRDPVMVTEVARPILRELSKEIVWPCSLLSAEGDEMVVRASTRSYSRLSFHPGLPGRRLPMLRTAAGRAYFAHIPDEERITLLALLQGRQDEESAWAQDTAFVRNVVRQTLRQGYARNDGDWSDEPKFGGLAVPLHLHGQVVGVLNTIFLRSAVREEGDVERIVVSLRAAASRIEQRASRVATSSTPHHSRY